MNINSNKSLSRLAAVQTLFQFDFNKKMKLKELDTINDMDISEIYQTIENINSNMEEFKDLKIDKNWFLTLVNSVFSNKDIIDVSLSSFLESNWSMERMDPTITNILRCAYIEFKNHSSIPSKVVINEYTNIASSFFNKSEVNFVNGVLDKVSLKYRDKK
ncbi:transcription antitermination factor NusB [Alphaproteobacteria bacterium]|jgi:transcription antitermination protein NusB|nr:transcription antitermination factor NusB [Alphaproteobacteria bacterium]|tara:strand:- start:479 stop:958 length:480 start_codon:yes stop_codon:yes gene_type:complete